MNPAVIVVDMLKDNFKYRHFALDPLLRIPSREDCLKEW